ncbi:MAG: alpha/beta hydrolase family protein [Bryobacteraceae bacterium]
MSGPYARWMDRWETQLANVDQNRVQRPFEWGLDWLDFAPGLPKPNGHDPAAFLAAYSDAAVAVSDRIFDHRRFPPRSFALSGSTLSFPSVLDSPHPENNTVYAEYFPAPGATRAVLVIPQWNSDDQSHLSLCALFRKLGITALRLSKAYHHRRKPPETARADYHVSSNLGRTIHATCQSVLDARCAIDFLEQQGFERIGIVGTSLGSCVALLTAAHDARLRAAAFNHVSMYFADVVWTGMSCRHIRASLEGNVTSEQLRRWWLSISPAAYLDKLSHRDLRSRLIWGRYDTTFRPEYSALVLDGFRQRGLAHDVFCLPCGHYTTGKFPFAWMDAWAICRYLYKFL